MLTASRAGGDVRALQQLLAAHALAPRLTESALYAAAIARRTLLKIIETPEAVSSVAFNPDGTIATGGDDTVRPWDAATGKPVGDPLTGHTNAVTSVAFSRDGTRIATAGDDHTVRLWDAVDARGRSGPRPAVGVPAGLPPWPVFDRQSIGCRAFIRHRLPHDRAGHSLERPDDPAGDPAATAHTLRLLAHMLDTG